MRKRKCRHCKRTNYPKILNHPTHTGRGNLIRVVEILICKTCGFWF